MTDADRCGRRGHQVKRRVILGSLVCAVLLIWLAVLNFLVDHSFSLYDDAYIYLRYVDNIFGGCGLRFNCAGDAVEGFSGPLYLLSLVLGRLLSSDLESLTQVLGCLFLGGALTVTALTALDRKLLPNDQPWTRIIALLGTTLVLASDHFILLNAVTGMETGLACLVVAMVFRAVIRRQPRALGVCLVLAVLTRPECLLFVLALPLLRWTRTKRLLVPLACALLATLVLRWVLFSDILPNTYWAKAGGTTRHFFLGLEYIVDAMRNYPLMVLCPLALLIPAARRQVGYLLVVSGLWLGFFLRSGGDTFAYSRLLMPLVPTLTLLGVAGLTTTVVRAVGGRRPAWIWTARAGMALVFLLTAGLAYQRHEIPPAHGFPNVERWTRVGHYLAREHRGKTIATVPIGAIGYFSRLDLLDLVGLTSRPVAKAGTTVPPALLGRKWIGHERHNTAYVLTRRPDLIVMTKWSPRPWTDLRQTRAGFYAEWLLLRAIKEGRAPYRLLNAEVAPGLHWLMFSLVR